MFTASPPPPDDNTSVAPSTPLDDIHRAAIFACAVAQKLGLIDQNDRAGLWPSLAVQVERFTGKHPSALTPRQWVLLATGWLDEWLDDRIGGPA